jgi:hypothetical protein
VFIVFLLSFSYKTTHTHTHPSIFFTTIMKFIAATAFLAAASVSAFTAVGPQGRHSVVQNSNAAAFVPAVLLQQNS